MNIQQQIAFIAYCLSKGKGNLTPDELSILGRLAAGFVKVGDRVERVDGIPPMSGEIPHFVGTVVERRNGGLLVIQLDEEIEIASNGYRSLTDTIVISDTAVRAATAVEAGGGDGQTDATEPVSEPITTPTSGGGTGGGGTVAA